MAADGELLGKALRGIDLKNLTTSINPKAL